MDTSPNESYSQSFLIWLSYGIYVGSFEYEEWLDYIQNHNLDSAVITEPPCNFIVSSHAQGKKW